MLNCSIVMIGVSTGGPVALKQLFAALPPVDAAIVVVLHVPPGMDAKIARSLNAVAAMPVALAQHGDLLQGGRVYLAPGGRHLRVERNSRIILEEGPRVNFVIPAADVSMLSLAKPLQRKIVGVVLTGMGNDGAAGIRHIKGIGGMTIAQDKESSSIYSMPKAAIDTGAVDYVLPPAQIARKLVELLR